MEVRPSKTKPRQGIAKVRVVTVNQNHEAVQTYVGNLIVMRRLGCSRSAAVSSGSQRCAIGREVLSPTS